MTQTRTPSPRALTGDRSLGFARKVWGLAWSGRKSDLIVEGYGLGLIGNIVVGTLGAVLGGVVFAIVGFGADHTVHNVLAATLGAICVLLLAKLIPRGRA